MEDKREKFIPRKDGFALKMDITSIYHVVSDVYNVGHVITEQHTCELAAFFQQVSASVKDDPFLLSEDWLLGVRLASSTTLAP